MPNNNNINGDKMILDVELTAKPITDEFWILTDGKNKVGNVCANNIGTFNVTLQNDVFEFEIDGENETLGVLLTNYFISNKKCYI